MESTIGDHSNCYYDLYSSIHGQARRAYGTLDPALLQVLVTYAEELDPGTAQIVDLAMRDAALCLPRRGRPHVCRLRHSACIQTCATAQSPAA